MQSRSEVVVCLTESILNFCAKSPSFSVFYCDSQGLCSTTSPQAGSEKQEIQGKQIAVVNGRALRRVLSCRPAILA